jgi:hypothetical protein
LLGPYGDDESDANANIAITNILEATTNEGIESTNVESANDIEITIENEQPGLVVPFGDYINN